MVSILSFFVQRTFSLSGSDASCTIKLRYLNAKQIPARELSMVGFLALANSLDVLCERVESSRTQNDIFSENVLVAVNVCKKTKDWIQ